MAIVVPDGACPTDGQLANALQAEGIVRREGDPPWLLGYQRATVEGMPAVRFEMRDREGTVRLQRAVRAGEADCRAVAETLALIARRFFDELHWTAHRPLPVAPPVARTTEPAHWPVRLWLEAGGGFWNRRGDAATGTAGARLEVGPLGLAFQLLLPALQARESRATGGQVTLSAWAATAAALYGWHPARFALALGPAVTVARESGRSAGIDVPKQATGTTLAAGLDARAAARLSPRWQLGLQLFAMRRVAGDEFAVAGWGRVLGPPPLEVALMAQVACALAP